MTRSSRPNSHKSQTVGICLLAISTTGLKFWTQGMMELLVCKESKLVYAKLLLSHPKSST